MMYSVKNFMDFLGIYHEKLTQETKDNKDTGRFMKDYYNCFSIIYIEKHIVHAADVKEKVFNESFIHEKYFNILQAWPHSPIIGRLLRIDDCLIAIRPTDAVVSPFPTEPGDLMIDLMEAPVIKELLHDGRLNKNKKIYEYVFSHHSSVRIYISLKSDKKVVWLNEWEFISDFNGNEIEIQIPTYDNFGFNGQQPPLRVKRSVKWINYYREKVKQFGFSADKWGYFVNTLKSTHPDTFDFLFDNIEDLYVELEKQLLNTDGKQTEEHRLSLFAEEPSDTRFLVRALFMLDNKGYCMITIPTIENKNLPYYAIYQPFISSPNCAVI